MRIFEKQHLDDFMDRGTASVFADLEFRQCSFTSSGVSITRDPRLRSTVRNVKLLRCEARGCVVDTAIIEEVLVEGLKTHGLLQCWGAVLRHVTLRGRVGRIMLSRAVATATALPSEQRAFDEANAAYYAGVDWALDISEAEFEEADLRGVPAELVRRDPETQVIVTREKAMRGRFREPDLSGSYWARAIPLFLERGDPSIVYVAPKRHRNFRELLDGLMRLRDAGVAEPD